MERNVHVDARSRRAERTMNQWNGTFHLCDRSLGDWRIPGFRILRCWPIGLVVSGIRRMIRRACPIALPGRTGTEGVGSFEICAQARHNRSCRAVPPSGTLPAPSRPATRPVPDPGASRNPSGSETMRRLIPGSFMRGFRLIPGWYARNGSAHSRMMRPGSPQSATGAESRNPVRYPPVPVRAPRGVPGRVSRRVRQ